MLRIADNSPMLSHGDVWRAIDRLSHKYGLSASGLARSAGLDLTTFNKIKRVTREGKNRWPGSESVAKGATLNIFDSCFGEGAGAEVCRNIPLIEFAQAGLFGFFDNAGYPTGAGLDKSHSRASPIRKPMHLKLTAAAWCQFSATVISPSFRRNPVFRGATVSL